MRKAILSFLAGAALLAGTVTASAATPDEHQHVRITNHPVDGKPIPAAPYTFNLQLHVHDMRGVASSIRVSDGSTVKKKVGISLAGPTNSLALPFVVDFSTWAVGRHELRWTLNRAATTTLPRIYQSSAFNICVVSCTPNLTSGRGSFPDAPFIEARGWQNDYANVRILTAVKNLRPGSQFVVQASNRAVAGECLLNPNIHAGSRGLSIGRFTTARTTITIPGGAAPGDKVVCHAHDATKTFAGVLAIVLPTEADPAFVDIEAQGWWNPGGLVVQ